MTDPRPASSRPSRRPILVTALIALPVIGALVLAFGLLDRNGAAVARECVAAEAASGRIGPLARGEVAAVTVSEPPKPAPAIAFQGPAGQEMTLADLRGRTVLVNLWATWCAPCRREMPALDRLQAELGGPDFEVVAINVDTRDAAKPRAWLEQNGITRLAYYADPEAKVLRDLQRTGHVVGLPTTLLIDGQGCELAVLKGPAEWASEDALQLIRAALGR